MTVARADTNIPLSEGDEEDLAYSIFAARACNPLEVQRYSPPTFVEIVAGPVYIPGGQQRNAVIPMAVWKGYDAILSRSGRPLGRYCKCLARGGALATLIGSLLLTREDPVPALAAPVLAAPPFYIERTGLANPLRPPSVDVSYECQPAFVDIDGDGDGDVFVGAGDGMIKYFKNVGSASVPIFVEQTGVANPFNGVDVGGDSAPTFVDVDGDGDFDAFAGELDGTIKYFKNTGSVSAPAFAEQTGAANPFNDVDVGHNSAPTFVDIDNDGDFDVFGGAMGAIWYFQNTGSASAPVFVEQAGAANPFNGVDVMWSTPAFVDIDADGDFDAFVGELYGTIKYFKNTGSANIPVFAEQTGAANPFNGVDVGGESAPTFVDIDDDGDVDAFVGEWGGMIKYFKNTGTASTPVFVEQTGAANPCNGGIDVGRESVPAFVDVDGDGDFDAFIGEASGTVNYFKNTGSASVPVFAEQIGAANPLNGVNVYSDSALAFVDIDGDGDFDAFVGEYYGTIQYFKNNGSASIPIFVEQTGVANPFNGVDVGDYSVPTFVDVDVDGDFDAFVGELGGTIKYFRNTSSASAPAFAEQTGAANPFDGMDVGDYSVPTFVDVDVDGDFDAFVGELGGTIKYFKNTGSASAPVFVEQTGAANPFDGVDVGWASAPTFVDVDGDGDFDAFVGEAGGTVHFFERIIPSNIYLPLVVKD